MNDPLSGQYGEFYRRRDAIHVYPVEFVVRAFPAFTDFKIGTCRNDFWGIEEHVRIVACRKTG
jgi:hypothetical protein